jgi:hypothetical protein
VFFYGKPVPRYRGDEPNRNSLASDMFGLKFTASAVLGRGFAPAFILQKDRKS